MNIKQRLVTEGVEVWIISPHKYVIEHQQELLPDWDVSLSLLILVLQRANVSLRQSNQKVIAEKDRLRVRFIRFGLGLCFALRDRGYLSDIFDPRNSYPLLSRLGKYGIDDNTTVATLLNYPKIIYRECSLIQHPDWGDRIYPSTIATSAPFDLVKASVREFSTSI